MNYHIGLITISAAVITSFEIAREIEERFTYHFGKRAALELDYDKIRATPKWEQKSANPPVI